MNVEISGTLESKLLKLMTAEGDATPEQTIEMILEFYENYRPAIMNLEQKLLAADESAKEGRTHDLDSADIKKRGRERLADSLDRGV